MGGRDTADGDVGLIQAFVNTTDLLDGPEQLTDPDTLRAWLVAHRLMDEAETVTEDDLGHAIAVREAMRSVIGANTAMPVYPVARATLNEAATASMVQTR